MLSWQAAAIASSARSMSAVIAITGEEGRGEGRRAGEMRDASTDEGEHGEFSARHVAI